MVTLLKHVRAYIIERTAVGKFNGQTPRITRERLSQFAEFHGHRPLNKLTAGRVRKWLDSIKHLSQGTRAAYLSTARGFCQWLYRRKLIKADPFADIAPISRPPRNPRALSRAQVAACFDACRDDRDELIVTLAVQCALRRSEITDLTWSDLDDTTWTLTVQGKGGKQRPVPVPTEARALLRQMQGPRSGPIVVGYKPAGARITARYLGDLVRRICTDAGVKRAAFDGVSTHAFRHTAASDVLDQAGGDTRPVSQLLGHAGLQSTEIYLRMARLEDVRQVMEGRDYQAPEGEAA